MLRRTFFFSKHYVCLLVIGCITLQAIAQSTYLPMHSAAEEEINRLEILSGKLPSSFSSFVKPYSAAAVVPFVQQIDSQMGGSLSEVDRYLISQLYTDYPEWVSDSTLSRVSRHPLWKHFYTSPSYLFQYKSPDFYFTINPVLLLQAGKEAHDGDLLFVNTRGLEMKGRLAGKIGFYTFLSDNQERPPLYVQQWIQQYHAVPGMGYYKIYQQNGVDYLHATGYISFPVTKYIEVNFGYGKTFLGEGFRSMFLSDFSNDYPYLKLNTNVWRLHYVNLFAELTSQFLPDSDYLRPKKYMALHDLSMDITKWLNVGVFESVIFSRADHFDFAYLNPVIFYRSVEQQLGSPDKAHVGFHATANVAHRWQFYGQFLFDELKVKHFFSHDGWWGNKWAAQIGGKYVNAFGISHLDLQGEINIVRPYTYTHRDTITNYTHYNQPLADPLGANFREWIGIARYHPIPRLSFYGQLMYVEQGRDTAGVNWGSNIFKTYTTREQEYGNRIGQGLLAKIASLQFRVSYEIKDHFFVDFSYLYRKTGGTYFNYSPQPSTRMWSIALRWNIAPRTYDF